MKFEIIESNLYNVKITFCRVACRSSPAPRLVDDVVECERGPEESEEREHEGMHQEDVAILINGRLQRGVSRPLRDRYRREHDKVHW